MGSAVGISSIVMLTTGFSAMASTSGYDAYKSALKNTKTVKNVTVQAAAALQDNGNVVASAAGSFKLSRDTKTASGSAEISANGTKQSFDLYKQKDQTVIKSSASDAYYVRQEGKGKQKHNRVQENNRQDRSQQVETVVDALVGNLKDYVTVDTKADGSKEISVQLDNAQLPAVVNAIAPIVIKEAAKEKNDGEKQDDNEKDNKNKLPFQEDFLKEAAPQLTQDIKIDKVSVKASVNASNYIEHQEAELTVSGKDDNGAAHEVTLHLQADLSGYNSTTPDTIDLTGKNVQTIKQDRGGRHE